MSLFTVIPQGPFKSNGRKQVSLSSCGWVLILSGQFKITDTLNAFTRLTGYEPNVLTFGELNDSSVPISFMIPSSDQDVDDVTLGEMLAFDGSGQLDGERMVDRSGQLEERDSSNAQIRTLLDEQRQMIIAEYRESRSSRTPCSSRRRRAPTSTRTIMATEIGMS